MQEILSCYQHIAIVGISSKQDRASYEVARYMQAQMYDIILINPRYAGQQILGKRVYATLAAAREAGETIEIVDVFRRGEHTPPLVEEASEVGARVLWLQLGISNDETCKRAQVAGITFIQDRCLKIEHERLKKSSAG